MSKPGAGRSRFLPDHEGTTGMHMRTRRFVAHFLAPFRLTGVDGLLPAGAYALDQEEELVGGRAGFAYRRVAMFMHLPAISASRWTIKLVEVDASEIETAILEHLEQHDGSSAGHAANRAD
jgi:hypothetical protein